MLIRIDVSTYGYQMSVFESSPTLTARWPLPSSNTGAYAMLKYLPQLPPGSVVSKAVLSAVTTRLTEYALTTSELYKGEATVRAQSRSSSQHIVQR